MEWRHKDTGQQSESVKSAHWGTGADEGWHALGSPAGANVTHTMPEPEIVEKKEGFFDAVKKIARLTANSGNEYSVAEFRRFWEDSAELLCTAFDGESVIARVYDGAVVDGDPFYRARPCLLNYMKTETGRKYTVPILDIGMIELAGKRFYFEMIPDWRLQTLADEGAFSFTELVELIRWLNEAMHDMHCAGIMHKNIIPCSLFRLDGRVVLGNFGVYKRKACSTYGYRPCDIHNAMDAMYFTFCEDYTSVPMDVLEKVDYYSLAPTLAYLFEGHCVNENADRYTMTALIRQGKLPLTREDENRACLENLLNGLYQYDSRCRFGYEDVCRWLDDHDYTGRRAGDTEK